MKSRLSLVIDVSGIETTSIESSLKVGIDHRLSARRHGIGDEHGILNDINTTVVAIRLLWYFTFDKWKLFKLRFNVIEVQYFTDILPFINEFRSYLLNPFVG